MDTRRQDRQKDGQTSNTRHRVPNTSSIGAHRIEARKRVKERECVCVRVCVCEREREREVEREVERERERERERWGAVGRDLLLCGGIAEQFRTSALLAHGDEGPSAAAIRRRHFTTFGPRTCSHKHKQAHTHTHIHTHTHPTHRTRAHNTWTTHSRQLSVREARARRGGRTSTWQYHRPRAAPASASRTHLAQGSRRCTSTTPTRCL
jgi:hypothetical protein